MRSFEEYEGLLYNKKELEKRGLGFSNYRIQKDKLQFWKLKFSSPEIFNQQKSFLVFYWSFFINFCNNTIGSNFLFKEISSLKLINS